MSTINVSHGDGCWPDLEKDPSKVIDLTEQPLEMAYMDVGTDQGEPSVAIKLTLPDGTIVFWQCDMPLWLKTNEQLRQKFWK